MNILKTLRDGLHAKRGDGDAPDGNSGHADSEDTSPAPGPDQPRVVGNGLPVKAKRQSGLTQ